MMFAIDTSTAQLGLALADHGALLAWAAAQPSATHAETILPMLEDMLRRTGTTTTNLAAIVAASGPGSFTGLRIGVATAKGLALALGIPYVLVPTLDAWGWAWQHDTALVVPLIDARKQRVYTALYRGGMRTGPWMDITMAELARQISQEAEVLFVGPDADMAEEWCLERPGWGYARPDMQRALAALAVLGERKLAAEGPARDDEGPLYLREPDIGTPR